MKKLLFIVLAAVVGGLAALGGAHFLGLNQQVKYVQVSAPPASNFANFADPSTAPPVPTTGFATAAEKALPAVVHIKASKPGGQSGLPFGIEPDQLPESFRDLFGNPGQRQRGEAPLQQGSGSGVIISDDGYIATNNHVVDGAESLEVVLNDQRTYEAEIIGTDPTTDIALIKIKAENLPTVQFADSDKLRIGEWVVAVGNPFSLTSTVTAGIVSAKGRSIDIVRRTGGDLAIESFIQTDAVVNPGNSGGALVDINGDLVGINTAISSPTGVFAGYSFAVPSAIVRKVVQDLREFGIVQRGLLGARITELNTRYAEEIGLKRDNGVYVAEVTAGSAAEEAGLQKGDVILAVDGVPTLRNSELLEQLGRRRPGDAVVLTFERDGQERNATARLKNADGKTEAIRPKPAPEKVTELGADFVELEASTAKELELAGGVIVAKIRSGILADQTRIRPGFIITRVDGRKVGSITDFERVISRAAGTVALEGVYPDDPKRTVAYGIVKQAEQ
ncbi:Do family serine endopeptidase [Neolewinella lacunae]|uniref:Do family serine endopeptidase n=1 Tax=Neolewinella lacunae TaxID=1517758 RepID=A0A923PM51_9BACT|nr:Do family serine endopeptidase [Neolewinella lacunae]MBC6993814.1 Do family serine endopeptidase [Neolewinella lacunae]MDN3635295.1 Do family serine endopeptidase [Neolewinella lacunae]